MTVSRTHTANFPPDWKPFIEGQWVAVIDSVGRDIRSLNQFDHLLVNGGCWDAHKLSHALHSHQPMRDILPQVPALEVRQPAALAVLN